MNERGFALSLIGISVATLLSIPQFPGAIIGVFFGFGIAFFVAGPCWVVASALQSLGAPATFQHVAIGLLVLYGLMVFIIGLLGWMAWRRGDANAGRLLTIKAVLFAALPLIAFLSTNAMSTAWH